VTHKDPAPTSQAVEKQLGLRLESVRRSIEMLIVRPREP
jgi:hypothetical protein